MNKYLTGLAIASVTLISGCASTLGVGNSEFGCTGLPQGVQCMSARRVYELTEQPGAVRADPYSEAEDGGKSKREAEENLLNRIEAGNPAPAAGAGHVLNASPVRSTPLPIRTQPQIMRIWIAPWESVDGDLHASGQIFSEIEPRRWNIGTPETVAAPSISPLQSIQSIEPEKR